MNNQQQILNADQSELIGELTERYGLEPEDIVFFSGDPKPFFTYEATCTLCNQLTDTRDINIEPIKSLCTDSISLRCTLTLADGRTRSAVGVANLMETLEGDKMSEQQTYLLASSRAIRAALRTAGIDLLKLHFSTTNNQLPPSNVKSHFATLIAQVHILGKHAGLIVGDDKAAWRRVIWNRYQKLHSNELSTDQLADFAAVLSTLVPQKLAA